MIDIILSTIRNCNYLKAIGFVIVSIHVLKIVNIILRKLYFRSKVLCGFRPWDNLGKWAVVTGGSDGIGKAYAEELAARGFHICLISRNVEKLNSAAEEIAVNYGISVKTISIDFTSGPEIYKEIENKLGELDGGIGVLVNNVGMSYKYAEYLHLVPDGYKVMWDLINSNVTSCTMMMKIVLSMMKTKGIIINVSSLMSIYPMPMLTVYSACKAYVDYLSRATQYEYRRKGITIQSVLPAFVATKMSSRRPSLEIPSAKTYVSSAIMTVGIEDYTYGYFPHKIRGFVHQWLRANMPASFNLALSMHFMKKYKEGYLRKIKKIEESQKIKLASRD